MIQDPPAVLEGLGMTIDQAVGEDLGPQADQSDTVLADSGESAASQEHAEQDAGTEVAPWELTGSAVTPVDPIESALIAMDPTKVYTPADIELQLVSIVARLEQGQHFQREWEMRANAAAVDYTLSYAEAVVAADGRSKEVREAQAILACRDEMVEKMTTEATVKAIRETMHNLRSMLSGFQSIGRSVGASFGAPNFNT